MGQYQIKTIQVHGRPSSVSIPRINSTSGSTGGALGHDRNSSYNHVAVPGLPVTPVIEWTDCNGNFIPPSSLNSSYFTSSCSATSTSRAVPHVTPVIEWIDCNGNFIPPSSLNSSYFTSSCIASSPGGAFSPRSPLPERIGGNGNFVYPSTLRSMPKTTPIPEFINSNGNFIFPSSFRGSNSAIHIASSTGTSTYNPNAPVPTPRSLAFKRPKRRRNGREGLAVYD